MKEMNIAKGLAMLCILFIHLAVPNSSSVGQLTWMHQSLSFNNIGGFVLPMFFIIAGYTYAITKKPLIDEIRQKIFNMFGYFVRYFIVTGLIFSLIEIVLKKYTIGECLRSLLSEFLTRSTCQFIGADFYIKTVFHDAFVASWFVWTYLFSMLLFILLMKVKTKTLKSELSLLIITGLISLGIYVISPELPFELNLVPSLVFLMYGAQLIKKYKLYQKFTGLNRYLRTLLFVFILLCGVYFLSFTGVNRMSHGTFTNPYATEGMASLDNWAIWLFSMFGTFLMSFLFIYLCRLLNSISFIGDYASYFGVNSFDTMLLHAFFAMSLCEISGLVCGRYLNAGDSVTGSIRMQCYLIFVLTVVFCYLWPKLKIKLLKRR